MAHLSRHTVATNLPEHEGIGVEQPVPAVVGEAASQLGLGGHAGRAFKGRERARVEGLVVSRFAFQGPGGLSVHRGPVVFVDGKVGVHVVPDVVLPPRR